jgi:hypothetical protein
MARKSCSSKSTGSISRAFTGKFSPEWLTYIGSEAAVVPSSEFSLENKVFKPVFWPNRGKIPHNHYGRLPDLMVLLRYCTAAQYPMVSVHRQWSVCYFLISHAALQHIIWG